MTWVTLLTRVPGGNWVTTVTWVSRVTCLTMVT